MAMELSRGTLFNTHFRGKKRIRGIYFTDYIIFKLKLRRFSNGKVYNKIILKKKCDNFWVLFAKLIKNQ